MHGARELVSWAGEWEKMVDGREIYSVEEFVVH
jgi:hypothetical protein